jgi:predicted small integral membrane protein
MEQIAWMAWTWQTAAFFAAIAGLLIVMTVLAIARPEIERVGVFGVATTRGDRLFIALLGSAFIHLAWLGLVGPDLWWASAISLVYAVAAFRVV